MIEIRNKDGEVISRSRNLRGLRRATGKQLVKRVAIDELDRGEGKLCVMFDSGDSCETNFASYHVLRLALSNWRNLYGAPLMCNGVECGKVARDNTALIPDWQ